LSIAAATVLTPLKASAAAVTGLIELFALSVLDQELRSALAPLTSPTGDKSAKAPNQA
jgi:hypothetical protein